MIYVTVGTMFMDFVRLIDAADRIALDTGEAVVVQHGLGKRLPEHCTYFDFKPRDEALAIQREARVIVTHAGIGCVQDALSLRKPLVVVPRLKRFGEHMNDHQLDLARAIERRGWGRMILDIAELTEACAHPPAPPETYRPSRTRLVHAVRDIVDRVAAGL